MIVEERLYMTNNYCVIDESSWKRAVHCRIFRGSVEPAFCVTVDMDITGFLKGMREKKYSFTIAMVYAICTCANAIEEFRYRFLDGKIVLYDRINTAFTYLNKETELFKVVNAPMMDTIDEYVPYAEKLAREQKEYFTGPLGNDVFQCSPLPWFTYTHISHTNSGKQDNAVPLFDWGRYYEKDGRIMIPLTIQASHCFVDGIHVGRLVERLSQYFDTWE